MFGIFPEFSFSDGHAVKGLLDGCVGEWGTDGCQWELYT